MIDASPTRTLQAELVAAGFDPGDIDGIAGPRTRAAVRALQATHGLAADGIVGPRTRALLAAVPPWMRLAGQLVGTREAAGAADNPVILGWARALGLAYAGDNVPWCGLFVAHCLASTVPGLALPATPLWARSWAGFGDKAPPAPGAIMVFWRGRRRSGTGHVGFHVGETRTAYRILGGNQGDGVSLAWLSKDRWLAARSPPGLVTGAAHPHLLPTREAVLSVDEA